MKQFDLLADHLSASDQDSMEWTDGDGWETARNILDEFSADDWQKLDRLWESKDRMWKLCLVEILSPKRSNSEGTLLLRMARNSDFEVAIHALTRVSILCGAVDTGNGVRIDESQRVEGFFALALADSAFRQAVKLISKSYAGASGGYVRRLGDMFSDE